MDPLQTDSETLKSPQRRSDAIDDGILEIRGSDSEIEVFVAEPTGRKRKMTGIGDNVNVSAAIGDYTKVCDHFASLH